MKLWLAPLWPINSPCLQFSWPNDFTDGSCAAQLESLRASLNRSALEPGAVFHADSGELPQELSREMKRFEFSEATMKALEYERHIAGGGIPTRDEFHDWFNGLVWLAYPQAKLEINRLHVTDEFSDSLLKGSPTLKSSGNQRSPLRDVITLWDESGLVLLTTDPSLEPAIRGHDWQHVFIRLRSEWGLSILPFCFGHGLLDAMRNPHKALCAKVRVVQADQALMEKVMDPLSVASVLDGVFLSIVQQLRSPRDLSPLPVMGVPGWFGENEALGFYEDEAVFRKKPTRRASS